MSLGRQIAFWLAGFTGLALLLHLLGGVVTPFAMGMLLGYLLDPIVRKLSDFGISRLGASIIILVVFVVILAAIFVFVGPILGTQLVGFAEQLPSYVSRLRALAIEQGNLLIDKYGGVWRDSFGLGNPISSEQIQKSAGDLVAQGAQFILGAARSLVSGGAALVSIGTFLIITPVVAFYMLLDWDRMLATVDGWLPLDHREGLRQIAREIDHSLAGWLLARAVAGLHYSCPVVRNRPQPDRIGFRLSHRPHRRTIELHSLCGLNGGAGGGARRCDRSGLAELESVSDGAGDRGLRPVSRRLRARAQARGRFGRPPSGLADVCAGRVRRLVRLHWTVDRGAGGRGDPRAGAPSLEPLPGQPTLSRP